MIDEGGRTGPAQRAGSVPREYFSEFGGCWTDRFDAAIALDGKLERDESSVGHYTPGAADPHYFILKADRRVKMPCSGGAYSSGHYVLSSEHPATAETAGPVAAAGTEASV